MNEQVVMIAGCLDGDETAIEQLIQEYQLGVFRLALSILNDQIEANEVTQDTFIAVLRSLKPYQETSTFKAWLYRIAFNLSISRLRKRKALERLQHALTSIFRIQDQHVPSLEETLIHNESDVALWKALEKLGDKHRLPIILRYYHDFSIKEIAEILQIKEGTVQSRLSIGRDKLRSELDGQFKATGE